MVEADKHHRQRSDGGEDGGTTMAEMRLTAAQHELEEESRLRGGTWHRLTPPDGPVPMDKYSSTALTVFLVIDPEPVDENGGASGCRQRDDTEEGMEILPNVTLERLRDVYLNQRNNRMTVVGSWATLLALERLREMGEID
jgi:hypothetical protein